MGQLYQEQVNMTKYITVKSLTTKADDEVNL